MHIKQWFFSLSLFSSHDSQTLSTTTVVWFTYLSVVFSVINCGVWLNHHLLLACKFGQKERYSDLEENNR